MGLGQTMITLGMFVLLIMTVISANRMLMENTTVELQTRALASSSLIASDLLEEILSKPFDQNVAATESPFRLPLRWDTTAGATNYRIQVSKDSTFTTSVFDSLLTTPTASVGPFNSDSTYYWHVKAYVPAVWGAYGKLWSFKAATPRRQYTDTVKTKATVESDLSISDGSQWGVRSLITLPDNTSTGDYNSKTRLKDIDDYDGYTRIVDTDDIKGFTVAVVVDYVVYTSPDVPTTTKTWFKRVKITVTHPQYLTSDNKMIPVFTAMATY